MRDANRFARICSLFARIERMIRVNSATKMLNPVPWTSYRENSVLLITDLNLNNPLIQLRDVFFSDIWVSGMTIFMAVKVARCLLSLLSWTSSCSIK